MWPCIGYIVVNRLAVLLLEYTLFTRRALIFTFSLTSSLTSGRTPEVVIGSLELDFLAFLASHPILPVCNDIGDLAKIHFTRVDSAASQVAPDPDVVQILEATALLWS
ncbi:hypothetical protein GGX14DRAFT_566433 [Mycena pura]|uniref:Uncharacterized protein n=1 Tax=Mycena pura TaxID=153505 RepID=A0AAD6VGR9_9AGAR|nr:hypothetical protein GGX14DRAFT_566433 [Mycena pura]